MNISKITKNKHFFSILIILIVILIISFPLFNLNNSKRSGDWRNGDTPGFNLIQKVIIEDHGWPLWDHYTFGGRPMAGLGMPLLYPVALILALFFIPSAVLNLMLILHLLLAGIGMYFLGYEVLKSKRSATIAAVIYSFSPYLMASLRHPFWLYGIAFIPLEFFLAIKTYKSKNYVNYSILLGIIFALHFLSSGVLQWYYAVLLVSFYFVFKAFGKNFFSRAIKSTIIIFIFVLVMFSLVAVRFLPSNEFTSYTNRGTGLPIEEILRVGHISFSGSLDTFIYPFNPKSKDGGHSYGQVGVIGTVFLLFGLICYFKKKQFLSRKKDIFLFLILVMIGVTIFATGIFIEQLYNLPGMSSQRGLDRSLILFVLSASLFAGYGFNCLQLKLHEKGYSMKKLKFIFLITLLLVWLSLFVVNLSKINQQNAEFEHYSITENNPVFLMIAEDKGIFRFHVFEVTGIDYNNFLGSSLPNEQESVYGTYGGGWDYRYFNVFLGSTFRDPSKLWGMFNVKYIISSIERENEDFELIEKFENVPKETINQQSYQNVAYLYENKKVMERSTIIPTSILVVGNEDSTLKTIYALIINPNIDPKKTIVVQGKQKINDYSLMELSPFDIVLLSTGSVDENSAFIIRRFEENGGIVFPRILEGENSINEGEIYDKLSEFNETVIDSEIEIVSYYDSTPNKMELKVTTNESALLFIAEKYTLYPGWTAKIDGKNTDILLANGVLSTINVPIGTHNIVFEYYPASFRKGLITTSVSLLLIVVYFIYYYFKKRKNGKNMRNIENKE